jgi:hypothetical protein
MMSSSPDLGHPTVPKSLPSIQKAGQSPWPLGILIRASTRPGAALIFPRVVILAEVYLQGP